MSPDLGSIRISDQGKEQLIKLKRVTGIKQWNTLCRWALCLSLADETPPLVRVPRGTSNVEMSWRTFSGDLAPAFVALIRDRRRVDGALEASELDLVHIHIHRGLGHLAGTLTTGGGVESLGELVAEHA